MIELCKLLQEKARFACFLCVALFEFKAAQSQARTILADDSNATLRELLHLLLLLLSRKEDEAARKAEDFYRHTHKPIIAIQYGVKK